MQNLKKGIKPVTAGHLIERIEISISKLVDRKDVLIQLFQIFLPLRNLSNYFGIVIKAGKEWQTFFPGLDSKLSKDINDTLNLYCGIQDSEQANLLIEFLEKQSASLVTKGHLESFIIASLKLNDSKPKNEDFVFGDDQITLVTNYLGEALTSIENSLQDDQPIIIHTVIRVNDKKVRDTIAQFYKEKGLTVRRLEGGIEVLESDQLIYLVTFTNFSAVLSQIFVSVTNYSYK